MRRFRRLTACVLTLLMVLSLAGTALAAPEPYNTGVMCAKCKRGYIHTVEQIEYKHKQYQDHNGHTDIYDVYEDKSYVYCDGCLFRDDIGGGDHILRLVYCADR